MADRADWSIPFGSWHRPQDRSEMGAGTNLSIGETSIAAKREDGVGELVRSFQGMSKQLKASFGDLRTSNTALRSAQDGLREANEGLEQRVIARTQEMAAFFDATMLTSESQDMSDLLEPTLSRILDISRCQAACIHLINEDQTSSFLVARQGWESVEIDQIQTLTTPAEFVDHISQTGDPILASDLSDVTAVPYEMRLKKGSTHIWGRSYGPVVRRRDC